MGLSVHTQLKLKLPHTRTKEQKAKISRALTGIPKSDEHKRKLSEVNKGKRLSAKTRRKMSDSRKGNPHTQISCPHCNKIGGLPAMHRWHFDMCKMKR